jgi:hypothetical protein
MLTSVALGNDISRSEVKYNTAAIKVDENNIVQAHYCIGADPMFWHITTIIDTLCTMGAIHVAKTEQ